MALNLKKELLNGDGIVPNCSSDESGSDCSSEELIDCDVIVDVTTVTTQNDENKSELQKTIGHNTDKNSNAKIESTKHIIIENLKSEHDHSNIKSHTLKVASTSIEVADKSLDKSCSIISRNSDVKHPQTKPTGILRGPDLIHFNFD